MKGRGKDDKSPFFLSEIFKNFLKKEVQISFIRDRDGLSDEWIKELTSYANKKQVKLYVLERYEIENYLLNPSLIFRAMKKKKDCDHITSEAAIQEVLKNFLKETITLRKYNYDNVVEDNIYKSANLIGKDEYRNPTKARKEAEKLCTEYEQRDSFEDLVQNGMGKETIKNILHWINHTLKFQLSFSEIVDSLQLEDLPDEISGLLKSIKSKESR